MISVAILLDGDRTAEELVAFSRLAVGLAGEGVHSAIVQSVEVKDLPIDGATRIAAPIPTISVPKRVPFWLHRRMASAVLDQMCNDGRESPQIIVCCGRGCLWLAEEMSEQLEVPLVFEARSEREIDAADPRKIDTLVAATANLRRHASRRHDEEFATHLPVAVPRTERTDDDGLVIALGPVGDLRRWSAMIEGLSGPGGPVNGLKHLALDLGSRRRDETIWRRIRQSPLSNCMSSFDHTDHMRGLLAGAHVVIVPDDHRIVRSIESQVRIGGGLVVAAEDPARDDRDVAIGDQLLSSAEARHPASWRSAVASALTEIPSRGSMERGRQSLVSSVSPRWAALLRGLVHGDATPIGNA